MAGTMYNIIILSWRYAAYIIIIIIIYAVRRTQTRYHGTGDGRTDKTSLNIIILSAAAAAAHAVLGLQDNMGVRDIVPAYLYMCIRTEGYRADRDI